MSEAKWYVVHTYSGYENKVKANIDKTIENRHLEDQILEVRVPMQDVVELKNGVQKATQKKMFPGYVLIHMIMNDEICVKSQWIRGLTFPFSILLIFCRTGIPHRHLLPYSFSHRPR